MASGVRDFTITFGSNLTSLALGVATQSVLAWTLGTGGRGSYAACVVFITVLNVLFTVGLDVALENFVAARRLSVREGVTYALLWSATGGLVTIAAGVLALQLPIALLQKASAREFLVALAWMPIGQLSAVLSRYPAAIGRFGHGAVIQTGQVGLQLALTGVLVGLLGWEVEGAILSGLLANVAGIALVLWILRTDGESARVRPSLARARELWSFGLRYYVGKISNIANIEFGTIIVAMFVGREEIGLFAVASSLVVRAEMIPNTLATVILPRIARDGDGRPELVAQCARATTVLCGILLAVLALFTTPIVAILFSPAFLPAVPLIRIMAFGTLVRCASKVVVPYLVLRNRPGLASVAVFSGMIVNFATLLALLPGLGLSAAALAVTLNHMCSGAILLTSFHNISGVRPAEFWRFRRSDWESLTRKMGWKQEAGEIADAARAGGGGRA